MSSLDDYKADTLILIVGSNPLPNYVAAMLLAKDDARIVFISTRTTEKFAHRIYDSVKAKRPGLRDAAFVEICEADRSKIIYALDDQLTPLIKESPNEVIGLNYTGGTKAMAAHTFDWVKNNVKAPVFSYLDSRTFQMFIDKKDDMVSSKAFLVLESVKVSVPELMQLHGFNSQEVKDSMKKQPQFSDASMHMVDYMKNKHKEWRCWCDNNLKKDNGKLKPTGALKGVILPKGDIRKPFQFLSVENDAATLLDAVNACNTDAEDLAKWLDGCWLEDYVLDRVAEVAGDCRLTDYCRNIIVETPKHFEFDVAFMKGYQLFGVSCTTSADKRLCKSKFFEAYIRTNQMGGDEARTALVCYYDKPEILQNELEKDWDAKGRIKVFGKDDIPSLKIKLKDWINTTGEDVNE